PCLVRLPGLTPPRQALLALAEALHAQGLPLGGPDFAAFRRQHHRDTLGEWTQRVLEAVPKGQWTLVLDDLSDLSASTGRLLDQLATRFVLCAAVPQVKPAHHRHFRRFERLLLQPLPPGDARRLIRLAATRQGVPLFYPRPRPCVIPSDARFRVEAGTPGERGVFLGLLLLLGLAVPLSAVGGTWQAVRYLLATPGMAYADYQGVTGQALLDFRGRWRDTHQPVAGLAPILDGERRPLAARRAALADRTVRFSGPPTPRAGGCPGGGPAPCRAAPRRGQGGPASHRAARSLLRPGTLVHVTLFPECAMRAHTVGATGEPPVPPQTLRARLRAVALEVNARRARVLRPTRRHHSR
ncbi:MAG: hypothetical protein AB1505_27630, partial [Candidatus Latescibacterota bacterium]